MNLPLFFTVRRALKQSVPPLDHLDFQEPATSTHTDSLVAALCMCVLGEHDETSSRRWPPRSLAELAILDEPPSTSERAALLRQGLDALDDLAMEVTGQSFRRLDRDAQMRILYHLESGHGGLSRRHARAFIEVFLALAAQAFVCHARPGWDARTNSSAKA